MIQRFARIGLLLLSAGFLVAAALMSPTHVTAIRVAATAQSGLTTPECAAGKGLPVSFTWDGTRVTETDYAPNCDHDVVTGALVIVYAASNDPTDLGPNANWILHPDAHDPFDFIGPNGLRGVVATLGVVLLVGALIWVLAERRARRRIATSQSGHVRTHRPLLRRTW